MPPKDPGFGPPPGSDLASPGPQIPLRRGVGAPAPGRIPDDNPGFQPPRDPLAGVNKLPRVVYRDIPLTQSLTEWSVDDVRSALRQNMIGIFDGPGQLTDMVLGDDRVQATLGSRISGLFGREVVFEASNHKAVKGSRAAKECLEAWVECWPNLATPAALTEMQAYTVLMGWEPAQLLWDTTEEIWCPYLRPWHPRYTYYHWYLRHYIAISQDGQIPITPGDGQWVLHAPYGEYRGWIRGAVRAVSVPWLIKDWARRDWARFSEVHGIPIKKAFAPAASDEKQRDPFEAALSNLGNEPTILLPLGVDGKISYDLQFAEPEDDAWQSFPGLMDRCDMSIVLALLFQNLTTEVQGGSFAATTAHMDIRQGGLEFDNRAWRHTLRNQIARPFAQFNFGDPRLAPWTHYDITSQEEYISLSDRLLKFSVALQRLRAGGVEFKSEKEVRKFAHKRLGLHRLPAFTFTPMDGDKPMARGVGSGGGGGTTGEKISISGLESDEHDDPGRSHHRSDEI